MPCDTLGHEIARNTVKRILLDNGIVPAPERNRKTAWKTFIKAHLGEIAAADFFTGEVVTLMGLVRYFVFFVIDVETRRVEIAGITRQLYTTAFRTMLRDSGVKVVRLPARSPNLNAYAERFVLSIKSECLNRIIPLGESHLRRSVSAYVRHYHGERHHQGLGGKLIEADELAGKTEGEVRSGERLGGMLNFYYRDAA